MDPLFIELEDEVISIKQELQDPLSPEYESDVGTYKDELVDVNCALPRLKDETSTLFVKCEYNVPESEDMKDELYASCDSKDETNPVFVKCEYNVPESEDGNDELHPSCDSMVNPEIAAEALNVNNNLLPQKSRKMYEKLYGQFMDWRKSKDITSFTEDVMLAYFEQLSLKLKSSTLWTHYSILKSTLNIKQAIDISRYLKLNALLKGKSEGYKGKKAKTFTPDELKRFIDEAPDAQYLLMKVASIFGIMGACRRHELHDLKLDNVKDVGSTMIITIPHTKTKSARTFTVTGKYYEICKKYINLRPEECNTPSFFIHYLNGKCTVQNVGINKLGNMGKEIAQYLNLPNPDLYTGHCFRRSSATILVDAGGDITLKRHGRWQKDT